MKDYVHAEVARLMSWSFKILQEGRFPDRGYYGEELPAKSSRGKSRGLPLAGGWKILGLQFCLISGCGSELQVCAVRCEVHV